MNTIIVILILFVLVVVLVNIMDKGRGPNTQPYQIKPSTYRDRGNITMRSGANTPVTSIICDRAGSHTLVDKSYEVLVPSSKEGVLAVKKVATRKECSVVGCFYKEKYVENSSVAPVEYEELELDPFYLNQLFTGTKLIVLDTHNRGSILPEEIKDGT